MKNSTLALIVLACLFAIYALTGYTLQTHPEFEGHPLAALAGVVWVLSLVGLMLTVRIFERAHGQEQDERNRKYRAALLAGDAQALKALRTPFERWIES